MAIAVPTYNWAGNGSGGVNYTSTLSGLTIPTTREAAAAGGIDVGAAEKQAADQYAATRTALASAPAQPISSDGPLGQPSTTTGGTTGGTTGPTAAQIATITGTNQAIQDQAGTQVGQLADQQHSDLWQGGNGMLGILPTMRNLQLGQTAVDQGRVQNSLARTQGLNGVLQMVNHGIQSGGIQLANSGASNSSAAEALARAYGLQGREAASQVGNQYAQNENQSNQKQNAQDVSVLNTMGSLRQNKADAINAIVNNAGTALTNLNTQSGILGVNGVVNVEAEKQSILANALKQLSEYDNQVNGAHINTLTPDQVASGASDLATAGTAATAPYNYTTTGPAQFQNTGPSPSELPIYVSPSAKKQT